MMPVFLAGVVTTLLLQRRLGVQSENPIEDASLIVGFGAFAAVGSILMAKRPRNPIGWIMAAAGLMVGVFPAGDAYAGYVISISGRPIALAIAGAWVGTWYWFALLALTFVFLPLLFPDGRLPSRRWTPVAVVAGIGTAAAVILGGLTETLSGQDVEYQIDNPIGIKGLGDLEELPLFWVLGVFFAIGLVGAVASVAVRFRRSRGPERQQLKVFLYAVIASSIAVVSGDFLQGTVIADLAFSLALVGLPSAVAIAVLRYRLYEIDRIISRTVSYAVVVAVVAAIYVAGVFVVQSVVPGDEPSDLAVAGSTLFAAALFLPLRRKVQEWVERRFNRSRYDATRTVEALGNRLRDQLQLSDLKGELQAVATTTMQPASVVVWLREGS